MQAIDAVHSAYCNALLLIHWSVQFIYVALYRVVQKMDLFER